MAISGSTQREDGKDPNAPLFVVREGRPFSWTGAIDMPGARFGKVYPGRKIIS